MQWLSDQCSAKRRWMWLHQAIAWRPFQKNTMRTALQLPFTNSPPEISRNKVFFSRMLAQKLDTFLFKHKTISSLLVCNHACKQLMHVSIAGDVVFEDSSATSDGFRLECGGYDRRLAWNSVAPTAHVGFPAVTYGLPSSSSVSTEHSFCSRSSFI